MPPGDRCFPAAANKNYKQTRCVMKSSSSRKFLFVLAIMALVSAVSIFAQPASQQPASGETAEVVADSASSGLKYVAAAIAVGIACLASGMAVGKIGAAAMGAMAENSELSGKALPFVGLAEGICLWGFLVALFIILM